MCHGIYVKIREQSQMSVLTVTLIWGLVASVYPQAIWSSTPRESSVSISHLTPGALRLQVHNSTCSFAWVLGIWTLVRRVAQTCFNCSIISHNLLSGVLIETRYYWGWRCASVVKSACYSYKVWEYGYQYPYQAAHNCL